MNGSNVEVIPTESPVASGRGIAMAAERDRGEEGKT